MQLSERAGQLADPSELMASLDQREPPSVARALSGKAEEQPQARDVKEH